MRRREFIALAGGAAAAWPIVAQAQQATKPHRIFWVSTGSQPDPFVDGFREGLREPWYGGPLARHVEREGDLRLRHLRFDNSAAALRLCNFLLTENHRLREDRARG